MEYRVNRRTMDKISVIGLGSGGVPEAGEAEAMEMLEYAFENGINFYDMATSKPNCFPWFGKAFQSVRQKIMYQIHFGADYSGPEYGWSLDLDTVKKSVDMQLQMLKTDYIDYGFIHCIDESADWKTYQDHGILEYLLDMKKQGVVHHIGFSSHTPAAANEILDTDIADMMMFSINPGYDYQKGAFANGQPDERMELYRRCEAKGVGISVMKPLSAGRMVNMETSHFDKVITVNQCIQYALDKPGVLTVLPGATNLKQVKELIGYLTATKEQRDYSEIASMAPENALGICMYCGHCKPCPADLDINLINKYYDLAKAGDPLAADHYAHLEHKAGECLGCGHCNDRCPFRVDQAARMQEIAGYFGE